MKYRGVDFQVNLSSWFIGAAVYAWREVTHPLEPDTWHKEYNVTGREVKVQFGPLSWRFSFSK